MCDDACTLHRGLINKTVSNGAPARVTRGGLMLPVVTMPTTAAADAHQDGGDHHDGGDHGDDDADGADGSTTNHHRTDISPAAAPLQPFVIATRYPGGKAILLTALGRTLPDPIGWSDPQAHINLTIPAASTSGTDAQVSGISMPVVGLFGHFASVTLHFAPGCFRNANGDADGTIANANGAIGVTSFLISF